MAALIRGVIVLAAYLLGAWASWHIVGIRLWDGDDISEIATPAAMIATAWLIGRAVELGANAALSRWWR